MNFDKGADVSNQDVYNKTSLDTAIKNRPSLTIIQKILKNCADVNKVNKYGKTPLHTAIEYNASLETVHWSRCLEA